MDERDDVPLKRGGATHSKDQLAQSHSESTVRAARDSGTLVSRVS